MVRRITLEEDAYQALVQRQLAGETLSETVRRLAVRTSIADLAGVWSPESGAAIADAVKQNRAERMRLRRRKLGLD